MRLESNWLRNVWPLHCNLCKAANKMHHRRFMKRLALSIVTLALVIGSFAYGETRALTPREVRQSYNNCMTYLKWPRARQIAMAKKSRYTLEQFDWACTTMKRNGLKKALALESVLRRYQRESRQTQSSRPSTSSDSGPQSCSYSIQCRGDEHCVDRVCVEKIAQACYPSGAYSCSSGETCVDRVCK